MGYAAVAAAVVSAIGTGISAHQQNIAGKDARAANRRAARIEAIRAQRERTAAFRQNRLEASRVAAVSASEGTLSSSSVQGALSAQGTQAASNIQFANSIDSLNQQRQRLIEHASRAQQFGETAVAVSGVISEGLDLVG